MLRVMSCCVWVLVFLFTVTMLAPGGRVSGTATAGGAALANFGSGLDACTAPLEPVTLVDPTIITQCDQAGIQQALDGGGHITFACGDSPVTIPISAPLVTSATESTVIDGDGKVTLDGQNSTRILEKPFTPGSQDAPVEYTLTIQNMRFINGRAPAASENRDGTARGGALTATSPGTRLHIINSTFEDNATTSINDEDNQGGAVYAANVYETVIVGSVFENNVAGSGGGFGAIASGLIVYNSRFTANQAADDSEEGIVRGHGGAIHLDGVTNNFNSQSNRIVDICGSEFIGNTAVRGGGALKVTVSDNKGTKATYQKSTFRNNRLVQVPPNEGSGGAIYHIEDDADGGTDEDNIEIRDSTFEGNYAYRQGGAAWIRVEGNGRIVNSTFTGNEASERGTNRVGQGGALIINKGFIDITNATFANNFATFQGGAVFAGGANDPDRQVTLSNVIFFENRLDPTFSRVFDPDQGPVTPEFQGYHTNRPLQNGGGNLQYPRTKEPDYDNDSNNLITEPDSAILFDNPLLAALADNGGATQTMALQAGSPAIDAGNSGACPASDQRGVARPQGGGCDIGAYEAGGEVEPPASGPVLISISPALIQVGSGQDFTLTVNGENFTESSVIRWNGQAVDTTFVDATRLTATIAASDVSETGTVDVTVYDPTADEDAAESAARPFVIVEELQQVYLPLVAR